MSEVARNYRKVIERIEAASERAGRDPKSVRLIAVTKTVPTDRIREAIECGVTDIAENRLQEALTKREALADSRIKWHFIGHIQTNKARKVAENFDWIHSIDRAELAERLNDSARGRLPVLIEVKFDQSPTKSGVPLGQLGLLVNLIRNFENLDLCGLMTIPPLTEDPNEARPYFKALRQHSELFRLPELSMGMSHDIEVAVAEGATMVRVGTALFGERA